MNLTQYIKNLLLLLWNTIAFLCPVISQNDVESKQLILFYFQVVSKYFIDILPNFKGFIIKINLKIKNNSTAVTPAVANCINKNKNSKLNRAGYNYAVINQSLKITNSLYINKLKDAPATQILISNLNQHIIPVHVKIFNYRVLMIQLYLSYIKACSADIKKVMTITQDKCAYFFPFVSKNHCSQYNL